MAVTRCPLYILSGGNCFPDQRGLDNHCNYTAQDTQQHFGQKPFAPVASLKWPCAHWPYLPLIIIGWVPHGDTLVSTLCNHFISISISCFDNSELMMSEMRCATLYLDIARGWWRSTINQGFINKFNLTNQNIVDSTELQTRSWFQYYPYPPLSRVPGPPGDLWCCKNCEVTYHRYTWDWRSHSIRTVGVTRYQDHVRSPGESVNSKV